MKEVVRAACPGCQRSLNVPAEWIGKTVRCKHCGHESRFEVPASADPARMRSGVRLPLAKPPKSKEQS